MTKKVNITINGQPVQARAGQTVLEAATEAGISIPTLCHHPALEPIGACRICLIEISKFQPLHPACTYRVTEGLTIETHSPRVERARRFVLELLFSERNHYCMYCPMSGDCELQDLGYLYGLDHWVYPTYTQRFPVDASRAFFMMDHNRCVLCRRCVRACSDLVANHTLGLRERGAKTMITADLNVPFGESSCVSCGTCLQVCPTGALVDKRSAFMGRNVQTQRVVTSCSQCSLGCGAEVVVRGGHILRLEGAWGAAPNGGLLCQKGRFDLLYDSRPRVTQPRLRHNGEQQETDWETALATVAERLGRVDPSRLGVWTTSGATNEALYVLTTLAQKEWPTAHVGLFQPTLQVRLKPQGMLTDLFQADLILLVGADPAADQPVASFLIKRAVDRGARLIVVDGPQNGLAPFAHQVLEPSDIDQAVQTAARADRPVVLYGVDLTPEAAQALGKLEGSLFIPLEPGVNTRAATALGLKPNSAQTDLEALVLVLGEETPDSLPTWLLPTQGAFTVVQASYASPWTESADVVLPMAIWAERSGHLTNSEGRILSVTAAVEPLGEARPDWEILARLAEHLDQKVPGTLEELAALAESQIIATQGPR